MPILGRGILGLEMGTGYSTLGLPLDVGEMKEGTMKGADRDLVNVGIGLSASCHSSIPANAAHPPNSQHAFLWLTQMGDLHNPSREPQCASPR